MSHGRSAVSQASLTGKTVIITGCNTGIGKETAVDLAKRGGNIIMACRSEERALPAVAEVCSENWDVLVIQGFEGQWSSPYESLT